MIPPAAVLWEPAPQGKILDACTAGVWLAGVADALPAALPARLTPEERVQAEGMLDPGRRGQYAAGHALLGSIREDQGEPLSASLAHSGHWAVVAAARRGPVGVDVEMVRADRPVVRLSRRFFAAEEHAWLCQFPEEERARVFYALWTAKEALFKALGMPEGAAHFAARKVYALERRGAFPATVAVEGCRVGWFQVTPRCLGAYAVPEGISRVRLVRCGGPE